MRWSQRFARARANDESGFTLIELVVALALIAIVSVGFIASVSLGMRTVAVARQRQTASELASARLEHMRNIPFEQVALSSPATMSSDPTNPDYWVSSDGSQYDVNGDEPGGLETLIVDTANGDVLHLEDPVQVGATVMEIYQYATWVDDPAIAGAEDYRRLTVVIRYKAPSVSGVNKLYRSSTLFTPGTVTIDGGATTTTTVAMTTTTAPGATTTTAPGATTTTTVAGACAGDVTGPTGQFSIGPSGSSEDGFTASQNVSLMLSFTDACAPIVANFSNDGVTWGPDVTYDSVNPQVSWSLTTGNGLKTVYGRVRDGVGNMTGLTSHTVILDATAPGAPGSGNVSYTVSCSGTTRTVAMSWAAAVDGEGNLRGYRVYRSTDGTTWSELSPQPSGTSKSDSHSKTLNSVRYYVVAYDKAGNISAAAPAAFISLSKNQCSS